MRDAVEAPVLHIRLFGDLELRYGELLLPPFESTRVASLLAYLLLHRDAPQPRQRIAFLLWPDSSESQARTNLRHLLHTLRGALPDAERFIDVTSRTLQWRGDAPCWLDVAEFERSIEESDGREAVELYRGDLLEGSYDEWLLEEREQFRQHYLLTLERLARALEASGEYLQAIAIAHQIQRYDPLYEESYRLLMRFHNARGDRARAIRVYHECASTLERELGVEPAAATRETYDALLTFEPDPQQRQDRAQPTRSPLVGRTAEWQLLTNCWQAAETGTPQVVLVSGEAGIGKTRLVEEFRVWCAQRGALTIEARSYAAEGALAYGPVIDWLRSDALTMRRSRLERTTLIELARLLPEIGNLIPDLPAPDPLSDSDRRQRLFDALAQAVLAPGAPLLLTIDDLQWSDHETLQFIHYLVRVAPQSRLLIATTARREEIDDDHPINDLVIGLHALDRLTSIELERLSRQETALLAGQLAGESLDEADSTQIYAETEGNPLFVVESLRAGWLTGQTEDGWISPRVQAVIASRLAQLSSSARNLSKIAATIGRAFDSTLLAHASETDEETLIQGLDELWRRRIVREQGLDSYDFTHDKIREVAYLALSPIQRRRAHLQVAGALEQIHARDLGPMSGQLAGHYDRAGATAKAVGWYVRAAEMAQQSYANREAVRLLERALSLLITLPETQARDAQELTILTSLVGPLTAIEGQGARAREYHERGLELSSALGVEPYPPLVRSLALSALSQNDFESAQQYGDQLFRHGRQEDDDVLLAQAEYVLGIVAYWKGELKTARRHFESVANRARPEHRFAHILHYGHDPESTCLTRLGCTLWFLGHPASAVVARDAALAIADEIDDPYSHILTLIFSAALAIEMRAPVSLRTYMSNLSAWGSDRPHVLASAEVFEGYIDVLDGHIARGIARIKSVISDPGLSGFAPGQRTMYRRVLVESYAATGNADEGLKAASQLLELSEGVRLYEAEGHRMRAGFLSALGVPDAEVEAEYQMALDVARQQGGKTFELRTLTDLVHYRLERGDRAGFGEAQTALAELIANLPETQDNLNMREASSALAIL